MRRPRPGAAAGAPRAAIAPWLALCAACAGAPAVPTAPPMPPAPPLLPAETPERPGAVGLDYGPEPEVRLSPAESEAIEVARRRLARKGEALPRVSGALVLAARDLARGAAAGEPDPIGQQARRAALSAGLAYDAAPTAFLFRGPPERLGAHLSELVRGDHATHVGAGAVVVDGGLTVVVLASERKARLEPIPRAVAPGGEAVLAGRLAAPLLHPRVFVTVPSGEVREIETRGGAATFRARLGFPEPGGYLVEVVAQGRGGPEVAALLAITAGAAQRRPPAGAARREPEDPADPAAAEAAVVRALNALRARRGLSPLTDSPELSAAARAHSAAMLAQGKVAHVLPGSGELVDRLRRAGIPYRRAYENVARAGTALGAHAAAEESPAHLGNMLEPGATRVGVGIARGRAPSGGPAVYLTEILVEPPPDAGDGRLTPAARVAEILWKERARLGRPPLTSDPALDAIARAAAADLARRDATEPGDVGRRALALGRKVAAVDVFVTDDTAGAARSANLRDTRFGRVGIGAVTADSARFGPGRIFVTVLYTD